MTNSPRLKNMCEKAMAPAWTFIYSGQRYDKDPLDLASIPLQSEGVMVSVQDAVS